MLQKRTNKFVNLGNYLEKARLKLRDIIINHLGKNVLWGFENLISRYSLVGDTAFFEAKQFDWGLYLEENWHIIRAELDEILTHVDRLPNLEDISPDQKSITGDEQLWKTYFLYGYGVKVENNCQRCPETTKLVEAIPGMKTAFFTILLPGKHIPEHRGPYKGVIRCLLGLKIPEPKEKCRIRVEQEIRHWEEGKCLIFDDTRLHEVWNETKGIRVTLWLDIVRPLPFPLSLINHLFLQLIALSPYVRDANKNQKKWDQQLEEIFAKK